MRVSVPNYVDENSGSPVSTLIGSNSLGAGSTPEPILSIEYLLPPPLVTYSSRADFDSSVSGLIVEGWDTYTPNTVFADGSTVAGITYNAASGDAMVRFDSEVDSLFGSSVLAMTPILFFTSNDTVTFTFTEPITAFGIDASSKFLVDGAYQVTTDTGHTVTSVYDPYYEINSESQGGQFVGFQTTEPFSSVTFSAVLASAFVLDSMRFNVAQVVPEPTTCTLALIASCLACSRRRP